MPCIYTSSGGLPETHVEGRTGIRIHKDDPLAIIEAIRFLQVDPERYYTMRLAARKNAMNFTLERMAEDYVKLYTELFNNWNNLEKVIETHNSKLKL